MAGKKATIILLLLAIFILLGIIFYRSYYSNFLRTTVSLEKNGELSLNEAVAINFSLPVKKDNYGKNIRIEPNLRATVEWQNNNRKLVITPVEKWKMETNYKIYLPEGKSLFFSKIDSQVFSFSTPSYPKVTNFFPAKEAKGVILGIEDPIVVDFDRPIDKFSVKISTNPEVEMVYHNTDNKNQLSVLPKDPLPSGQKYEVRVLVKEETEKDTAFKEIYFSNFETPPLVIAPQDWEKDFGLRLEQAKKYTVAKVLTGRYIDVNLTSQVMSIFENGKIVDAFMVSTGKRGMETKKGEYTIHNKNPRAWSKDYGLWMPFWMAVAPDGSFGIHELPEWPSGYKEGANHLGTPVSHGCIRLGVGPAKFVYDFTTVGMPVIIY